MILHTKMAATRTKNSLPDSFTSSPSLPTFKRRLKTTFRSELYISK